MGWGVAHDRGNHDAASEIKSALRRALDSGKLALINVLTDPKAQKRGGSYL